MPPQKVANAAVTGFDNASAYDVHRPSYPADAVEALLRNLDVANRPRAKIVDLAAGTGKFTELLAAREEQYDIVAVEPVAKMRQSLVGKHLEHVEVIDGLATSINLGDGWADAVIAAQSFHWFANEEALKEIRRVLKPGGRLGIIWNIEDYNQPANWTASTAWEKELKQLILALPPDGTNRFRDDKWRDVFERQARDPAPLFAVPIGQEKIPFTVWLTKELLWDRIQTLSQVAVLRDGDKDAFRAKFDGIMSEGDQVWNEKEEVEFHGFTVYAWTRRI
ncbi:Methyltransferase type 11 [Metarhizium brunneum]